MKPIDYERRAGGVYRLINREISNKNIFIDSEFERVVDNLILRLHWNYGISIT